ncbi:hypothetical protein ACFQ6N_33615 [Kitasatospora sp. NPDC056446]|uniref:hypothetical protein n=1 Tax=Kitasatospora sp. NPDC056446 TaxID=3345819 RepID=UPI0036793AF1
MAGIRKTAAAAVLAVVALTATACNDGKGTGAAPAAPTTTAPAAAPSAATPSSPAAPSTGEKPVKLTPAVLLEQVTKKTGAAKSAKIDEVIAIGQVTMKGKGAVSWADGLQGEITMDLSDSPLGSVLAPVTGGTTAPYRYTKDAMYMRLGGDAVGAFGGRHWLHYSKADMATASGSSTDQLKSADPVQGVRNLIATGKVTEVGQETVAGKAATHYTGELSADDIAGATGTGLTKDELDQVKQTLDTAGITSETIDVWIDADQLVVKRSEQADTKVGTMKATVSYSDYGTPVTTTAPDPSDTVELSELAQLGKGSAG